jgi:hypothetical protein
MPGPLLESAACARLAVGGGANEGEGLGPGRGRKCVMKRKDGECTKEQRGAVGIYTGGGRRVGGKAAKGADGNWPCPKRQRQTQPGGRHARTGRAKPERGGNAETRNPLTV